MSVCTSNDDPPRHVEALCKEDAVGGGTVAVKGLTDTAPTAQPTRQDKTRQAVIIDNKFGSGGEGAFGGVFLGALRVADSVCPLLTFE